MTDPRSILKPLIMSDSYLFIAKQVLEARGRPLTAQQILEDAVKHRLLPEHLSGKTMAKTLQARIAEDVYANRSRSIFYRTRLGTYFLRAYSKDMTIPDTIRREYKPSGRVQPPPGCRILCFEDSKRLVDKYLVNPRTALDLLISENSYHFFQDAPYTALKVLTFTVVCKDRSILTHTVGKHSHHRALIGKYTIGFRRYIDEFDIDLFDQNELGAMRNSVREISRHFLALGDGIDDRIIAKQCTFLGAVAEPNLSTLSLVIQADLRGLEHMFQGFARRLDVNRLRWVERSEVNEHSMDVLSQIVLKEL